jgi:uncharacterized glyoxalase superfamily protein PhnB
MPIIAVLSVDAIRKFYMETLRFGHVRGAIGKDGQLDFCTLAQNGARIMFVRAQAENSGTRAVGNKQPVEIYLEVADVEWYFELLSENEDVKVTSPLATQWWGDRTFKVIDPNGYEIWFYQTVGEPKPPQGVKIV